MAVFKFPDDQRRLDWLILRDSPFVLYLDRSKLDGACDWFLRYSYQLVTFNSARWQSDSDFHDDISHALKFPDYYGRNLDALDECLRFDLDISQESGLLLVFHHFNAFKKFPGDFISSLRYPGRSIATISPLWTKVDYLYPIG